MPWYRNPWETPWNGMSSSPSWPPQQPPFNPSGMDPAMMGLYERAQKVGARFVERAYRQKFRKEDEEKKKKEAEKKKPLLTWLERFALASISSVFVGPLLLIIVGFEMQLLKAVLGNLLK